MVVAATHVVARSQGCRNRRTGRTSRARPAIKSSVFITLGSVQRPAERNHGPVSRNLQRADAQAARRRSLLEGQLLQLEQFDRLSLPPRQRSDRLLQHLPVLKALVVGIRWPVRKGYGGIVDVDLARGLPGITPRTVSETVTDNCQLTPRIRQMSIVVGDSPAGPTSRTLSRTSCCRSTQSAQHMTRRPSIHAVACAAGACRYASESPPWAARMR